MRVIAAATSAEVGRLGTTNGSRRPPAVCFLLLKRKVCAAIKSHLGRAVADSLPE